MHLEKGDRVLLCSDGLTEMIREEEINHILQAEAEPEHACRRLVTQANEAGGKDNITVVVADFRAVDQPEETARNRAAVEKGIGPLDPIAEAIPGEAIPGEADAGIVLDRNRTSSAH